MVGMIVFALIILAAIKLFTLMMSPAKVKGRIGEKLVARRLASGLPPEYLIANDIYIPLPDGTTTQIDHVVVSKYGIFVVETKNYSGLIFASADAARWTQTIYHEKNSFQNPIRQNFRHICALSERLNIPRDYFISVIAFTGDCDFKTERPAGVVYSREAADYIRSFRKPLIKDNQIGEIADAIQAWQGTVTDKMRKTHVQNLHSRHAATPHTDNSSPRCPRCGAQMVLRHRKSDDGHFYGCSKYPNCHGIVNVDGSQA